MSIGHLQSKLNQHSLLLDAFIPEEDKPKLYDRLIEDCYLISKNMNMSYTNILNISPTERNKLKKCLLDEAKLHKQYLEKIKAEREANRKR